MGLRDDILGKSDLKTEEVEVPEWGVTVTVTELSALDRERHDKGAAVLEDGEYRADHGQIRARLAAFCIVDGKGRRVFTDEDIEGLARKSYAALDRVLEVAMRLNRMGRFEEETRKN